jgi:hypothetical protein
MQAVGGVKGTQVLEFDFLRNITAYLTANYGTQAASGDWAEFLPAALPLRLSPQGNSVNFRDSVHQGQQLPGQFLQQDANCRLFYTAVMLGDVSQMWKAAAEAAWGGAPICIGNAAGNQTAA